MSEELIDRYVDRSGIQSDTQFILGELNKVYKDFKQIENLKVRLEFSDSTKELLEQLKKITDTEQSLSKATDQLVAKNISYSNQQKQSTATTRALADEQKNLAAASERTSNVLRDSIAQQISYKGRLSDVTEELKNLRKQQDELNKGTGNDEAKKDIDARIQKLEEEKALLQAITSELGKQIKTEAKKATFVVDDNGGISQQISIEEIRKLTIVQDQNLKSRQELLETSAKIKIQEDLLTVELRKTKDQFDKGIISQDGYEKKLADILERQKGLATASEGVNRALKNQEKQFQSSIDSTSALRAELNQLLQQFDLLTPEAKAGEAGQALKARIDEVTAAVTREEQATGRFQRNVGNYANSLASGFAKVTDEIKRLKQVRDQLNDASAQDPAGFASRGGAEEIQRVTAGIEQLEKVQKIGLNTNITYTQSVAQLERQYTTLATSGNVSEEFLKEFKEFVAQAKHEAGELRQEIKALSSETRGLDLAAGAIGTVASGFQAAAGASALLGKNSEDTEKTIVRLVAVQNVANGVREFARQLTERETLAGKAYAFVQKQIAIVTDASAAATARWAAGFKTLGIGAIIAGVVYLIGKISEWTDAGKDAEETTKALSESIRDQNDALQKNIDLIKEDFDGLLNLERRQLEMAEKSGKSAAETFKLRRDLAQTELTIARQQLNEQIKISDAFSSTINRGQKGMTGLLQSQDFFLNSVKHINGEIIKAEQEKQAALSAGDDKQAERAQKRLDFLKTDLENNQRYYDGITKAINNAQDADLKLQLIAIEEAKALAEKRKKLINDEKKAALELFKFRQGLIIEANKSIASDDSLFNTQAKIAAAKTAAEAEIAVINKTKEYELSQEGITKSAVRLINEKAANDILNINFDLEKRITDIRINDIQKQKDISQKLREDLKQFDTERLQDQQQALDKAHDKEQKQLETNRDIELKRAADRFRTGLTDQKGYEEKKLDIEFKYQQAILKSQLTFYENQLKLLRSFGQDTTALEATIANIKLQLSAGVADKLIADNEKIKKSDDEVAAKRLENLEKWTDYAKQAIDVIGGFIAANAEQQKNAIQEQIDALEKQRAKDIEVANQTVVNEQDKAAAIAVINARADAQKQTLEIRQRNAEERKLRFEKAATIAEIVLETALAVTRALSDKSLDGWARIATAAAVGVFGAAKLAVAISTPIPKYKYGKNKNDLYEGPAIVGDGGKKEIIVRENGQLEITPANPTLTYLSRRDIVLPDAKFLLKRNVSGEVVKTAANIDAQNKSEMDFLSLKEHLAISNKLLQKVVEKPVLNMKADRSGLSNMWQWAANQIKYINDQTNWNS